VSLDNPGPPDTSAEVSAGVLIDGHAVSSSTSTIAGQQRLGVPLSGLARLASGQQVVKVWVNGRYNNYYPGSELIDSPVTLDVVALPAL
jgi:hypothetical protein